MAQRRDRLGRFSGGGGGGSRMKASAGRTVKGGGEKVTGRTRGSYSRQLKNNENMLVAGHKAFAPYEKAVGKSSYANKKVKKLRKSGADAATIAKAQKSADMKENTTRLMRQRFTQNATIARRRYGNATGLVAQRRFARPN